MEAHEFLRVPIRVARCRQIRVVIEDKERQAGSIAVAVWLKNSSAPGAPAVYLGQQPIVSGGAGQLQRNAAPTEETLVFAIPTETKMRRFDEIAVVMLPDSAHQFAGPQIAIEQFELVPR
jgi:hypothetical protein